MPTIVDHDAIVALLESTWAAIDELYTGLDDVDYDRPTCCPGWTVRDQLAHIAATELSLSGEAVPEVDVGGVAHVRNEIGGMNERWVASMRALSGGEVLDVFRRATAQRLETLKGMTQADFDAPSWTPAGPDETYGRFMRIRHYDSFTHEHDTREAVGAADRDDPAAVASCLDETATALGFVVGRRAGIPEGQRVRIELTGPAARTYSVEVTDRARLVDGFDGEATVGLTMPSPLFLRLTAGRRDAGPHVGREIVLSGDDELARRLATNLAFTI
ncbi:maleylpyruvate isomerase family mycothiol-dependent enzyme [Rhabdothermincola salaria]|uniref:maleylpyruvate isomerase family mycothiol-dependent enzyme n=1 Tax=Rhabdothermincola salaria TaxID=2903142 RepID=UPI001E3E8082|nr:maleylpyruvate isomerase family mycothiol-dependent enzyme [Rhabdothermincola salaria]MCD9622862.1 maleylpyruvate isomerase family mycothiol-dependent enzyme [Rhabdothermincola salaria]